MTAGKAYVVGEKRPELFVPNTSGSIVPDLRGISGPSLSSRSLGGYMGAGGTMRERETIIKVQVEEGALFRPVVTQIAGQVAAPMAARAAEAGSSGAQVAMVRRQSRQLI